MAQIVNFADYIPEKRELQPIGIETIYEASKTVLDERAGLYLDIYGKSRLSINGRAEDLELYADADVRKEQIIFKIGYYNNKKSNKMVSIDVPFNIDVTEEAGQILKPETLSGVVIFLVTLLYAIAVITQNTALQVKAGNLTIAEGGDIQRLYEEKIRKKIYSV